MGARNGIFCGHVESDNLGSTGGSGGAGTKKICTSASAGIRSEAPNEPFFGTDTRWEPVKTYFVGFGIFNSPESVPHIHFGSHAEPLQKRFSNVKKSAIL